MSTQAPLGRDVDGKPIYAGSMVLILDAPSYPTAIGDVAKVVGIADHPMPGLLELDYETDGSCLPYIQPELVRLIRKSGDKADWRSIEKATGWRPSVQDKVPEAA